MTALEDIKAMSDATLKEETAHVTAQIGSLLKRREDLIEVQYERGLVAGGRGLQLLADRIATMLGLPIPVVNVVKRERDESGFWMSAQNVAYIVEQFIKQGVPE